MAALLDRDEWRAFSDFLALGGAALCVILGLVLALAGEDPVIAFHGCVLLGAAALAFFFILTQIMEKKETHDATNYADGVVRAGVISSATSSPGSSPFRSSILIYPGRVSAA
jgi:hypothetical protein